MKRGTRARWLIAAALFFGGTVPLGSESMTMTTYYPAPAGTYRRLTADSVTLRPLEAPPEGVPGRVYFNSQDKAPNVFVDGAWKRMVVFNGETIGTATLGGDYRFTNAWAQVGGLSLEFTTVKRGLYGVSWGGNCAIASTGKLSYLKVRFVNAGIGTQIQQYTLDDADDDDGTTTTVDIDGSTMLMLQADQKYRFQILGYKKGSDAANLTFGKAGMWLKVEELFTF
ncbi:MAG: hypothetical protein HY926_15245 [Elusimicrobia bacterium]|nr:hypothetical protein [Elusimicrobiota bacterium]